MKTLNYENLVFEIVDAIPKDYTIWSIGKNMKDGYLPLCKLKSEQPFEGGKAIEVDTLKAIPLKDAQIVLAGVGFTACDTIEQLLRNMGAYIKKNAKSNRQLTQRKVERIAKALEILESIEIV